MALTVSHSPTLVPFSDIMPKHDAGEMQIIGIRHLIAIFLEKAVQKQISCIGQRS
jgi:hypothetical protein